MDFQSFKFPFIFDELFNEKFFENFELVRTDGVFFGIVDEIFPMVKVDEHGSFEVVV